MWKRDFALIKAMGANTVRLYGWNATHDHKAFLDAAHDHGLMLIVRPDMCCCAGDIRAILVITTIMLITIIITIMRPDMCYCYCAIGHPCRCLK